MKNTGLLIAAIVLAALSGLLYWSNRHPASEDTTKSSADVAPKILSLKPEDIAKVSIKKKGEEELALAKSDSGKWQITSPKALGADQEAVSSMVSTLATLGSERLVDEKPGNLGQYGLQEPALEVGVTTKDGKAHTVALGDETPTGSAVFAKLDGDPRVFTVARYEKNSIDKTASDLKDKRLLTADFDKVSQIELITKKEDLTFSRNKQEWQILKPRPLRADNFQVEEIVRKLKDARMESSASEDAKKSAADFAAGTLVATARVTDASGTQELQIRKNKNDYYAKSNVVTGVYKVTSDVGTGLDKKLEDFRNKKLFDFGYDEPSKVEIRDGAKDYSLSKGGQDWWLDGKKMEASGVQALIDKIRGLSASKFPESGFSSPAIDVTVTSSEGKRSEKVSIAKNGDRYVAKRDGELSLYELDSSIVTEMEKSAADLKAAPAEAPKAKK